jgi:hypothetical protein
MTYGEKTFWCYFLCGQGQPILTIIFRAFSSLQAADFFNFNIKILVKYNIKLQSLVFREL